MRRFFSINSTRAAGLAALVSLAGCAAPVVVQTGDQASVSFTCRLKDGLLAATTRPDPDVTVEAKSPFYLPRNSAAETIIVTAGPESKTGDQQERLPFEQEIVKLLGPCLPGAVVGREFEMELTAERYPVADSKERVVRMATVRKRDKEMRLSRDEYTTKSGREPAPGQPFVLDPLVPGSVSEVTEKDVLVRFAPVPGNPLTTPFGPVMLRETPERYELVIAAEKGRLVRAGAMAGRIIAVDDESFAIDFGHPFGGEKLDCRVQVAGVERAKPAASVVSGPLVDQAAVSARLLENALKFQQENPQPSLTPAAQLPAGELH